MKVELVFGDEWINVTLPETTQIVKPGFSIPIEPASDLEKAVYEALTSPLDVKPLSDFVKPYWKITIAFDDPTVPCYAPVWETTISAVLRELKKVGVSKSQITLLCANALHRKFRLSELETILGASIVQAFKDRIELFVMTLKTLMELCILGKHPPALMLKLTEKLLNPTSRFTLILFPQDLMADGSLYVWDSPLGVLYDGITNRKL